LQDSNIAWCHNTHNFWRGCSGRNCPLTALGLCFAEDDADKKYGAGSFKTVERTAVSYWDRPRQWNLEAVDAGYAIRVFCGSWMDFCDKQADRLRPKVWPLIKSATNICWMLLTKCPERFPEILPPDWGPSGYENCWLGASALHSEDVRRNTGYLRAVPAARKFLSLEPLAGPVKDPDLTGIDQIIVGGLSGRKWDKEPKVPPMKLEWAVDLYHSAKAQNVCYFFKQISARYDEQGIDALGKALDGQSRVIQEVPDAHRGLPWAPMRQKGDLS
jgi:protein gp37